MAAKKYAPMLATMSEAHLVVAIWIAIVCTQISCAHQEQEEECPLVLVDGFVPISAVD